MNRALLKLIVFACVLSTFCSCARDVIEKEEDVQKRILDAWVKVNYGAKAQLADYGAYILEKEDGTGSHIYDSSYVFVDYSVKSLDGTYITTNIMEISKQLGTYSSSNYYGNDIWQIGAGAIYPGLEEVLKKMKSGGKVTVVLPPAATEITNGLYTKIFTVGGENDNLIYEISVNDIKDNIYTYQKDLLKEYSRKHYNGVDSLIEGLYLIKTEVAALSDTIPNETSIKVRYTGRTLDGRVFDTNIKDTAKKYRFYDSTKEYTAMEQTFRTNLDEYIKENSVVSGFAKAITQMRYGEKAVVFFWSKLGYKEGGSNNAIPGYSPLLFELYIEPKK